MEKEGGLEDRIKTAAKRFLEQSENKEIQIISHYDTDGITSATIMIKCLKRLDKKFSLKIVKNLDKEFISKLPKEKVTLFLDLASNSLKEIEEAGLKNVFILDHHEITQKIPPSIEIVNPELYDKQEISAAGVTYLFCKEINPESKELAKLAILGMIGDLLEKNISKLNSNIVEEGGIRRKKGLLLYPSTRPIDKVLEFCSNPYLPGITGNPTEIKEILREAGIVPHKGKYKSLIELNDKEMEKLVTAIILRNPGAKQEDLIGEIFLIKHYNKLEDGRELSAKINACSRLGKSDLALQFCLEFPKIKKQVESMHAQYKQHILSALQTINETKVAEGNDFVIFNAKNKIKDTIIGTIATILSSSTLYYKEGTSIITMAYSDKNKIKVSARSCKRKGRNVREILEKTIQKTGGEIGGHAFAAGCTIPKSKEKEFLQILKRNLEFETIKISQKH